MCDRKCCSMNVQNMANVCPCTKTSVFTFLKKQALMLLTVAGALGGFIAGFILNKYHLSADAIMWIGLPGEMYMRMLQMMILPLIICSVITGTASVDPKSNGRVSLVALTYIVLTNAIPVFLSIAMSIAIKPGVDVHFDVQKVTQTDPNDIMDTQDIFADLIRNVFPDNIVTACFQQTQTKYSIKEETVVRNISGVVVENTTVITRSRVRGASNSPNALGLVFCCMIFGIAVSVVGEQARPFFLFFQSATVVILKLLRWLIWYTPVGVLSLISVAIARADRIEQTFTALGLFAVTVVASLAIYQLILLPLVVFIVIRRNPYVIQLTWIRAWMVVIASASSAVAIPEGMLAAEKLKIDRRIAQFVIPLATAINRDGSTIFMAAACFFIGQRAGVDIDGSRVITIWLLTSVLSLAIPALPSASIVCVIIILTALGISVDQIGLLFALDWFLDRLRGGVNQISLGYCTVISYHFAKSVLPPEDPDEL